MLIPWHRLFYQFRPTSIGRPSRSAKVPHTRTSPTKARRIRCIQDNSRRCGRQWEGRRREIVKVGRAESWHCHSSAEGYSGQTQRETHIQENHIGARVCRCAGICLSHQDKSTAAGCPRISSGRDGEAMRRISCWTEGAATRKVKITLRRAFCPRREDTTRDARRLCTSYAADITSQRKQSRYRARFHSRTKSKRNTTRRSNHYHR